MRRRLVIGLLVAVAAAGAAVAVATSVAGAGDEQRYTVVLDNAFGLTEGSDLRAAGVSVGSVRKLDVQRSTARALAKIVITSPDFAGFRSDVRCEVKPQSLIGEYYLDCEPGKASEDAPKTIPVEQTAGTISPDVVLDILRRPARERFGLILSELGMGLAARGDDLRATIRRGVPALRETERVLEILADNRRTLQDLTRDADRVLVDLASNRRDVARFVKEAGDMTTASAQRRIELAGTVNRPPGFLRELRPTLRDLGTAATEQAPALADLRAAAPQLTTTLKRLGPFAESARPAVRGLGEASEVGSSAVREARSTVKRLRELGTVSTEPMRNLRFVLEDVDDRERAVEPNRLSPTGKGFTGLEALMQYFFVQSQALNIYDSKSYILKLGLLVNECSEYTNAEHARSDPERTKDCRQWLGPNQPGVTTAVQARGEPSAEKAAPRRESREDEPEAPDETAPTIGETAPAAPPPPPPPALLPGARELLDDLLPGVTDKLPGLGNGGSGGSDGRATGGEQSLLDYLLGP